MNNLNLDRVLTGGLLAGLIINAGEILLNVVLLAGPWQAAREALGLGEEGGAGIALYIGWGFINGLVVVGLYAAIRPRFGAGPRTALVAGAFVWALSSFGVALIFQAGSLFPPALVWTVVLGEVVIFLLASVAGAWVYKEEAVPA